jgi:hypothetical protein
VLLFVKTAPQPPVITALAIHALYFVLISACVWQVASVTSAGQVKFTEAGALTVKVRVQVCVASQLLVTVNVTDTEPPQANGAPMLLLVNVRLQPPVAVAEASQARYFTFICDCVWQAASVTFAGQLNATGAGPVTVKLRVQVTGASQSLVTVKVTVEVPPQALGVPGLLFVNTALQPPLAVAVASQAAYFVLI